MRDVREGGLRLEPIFRTLPGIVLANIARYLDWNPTTSTTPYRSLSSMEEPDRTEWLLSHRNELEQEFCSVGSQSFGRQRNYREIVGALAGKLSIPPDATDTSEAVESKIVAKVWTDAVSRLTPEQREQLKSQAEALAAQHGRRFGTEMTGFAALTAAQLSGFGVYLLGSTLLGAINGALGLGLGFGAFAGMSSLISLAIGPAGWAALVLTAVFRLGAPNYKKILPVVILIATHRQRDELSL
jgi:uncharacterized protein YaaW (UPF0174 family)